MFLWHAVARAGIECMTRAKVSDLDDFDLGKVSRGLEVFGIAQLIKAIAHDTDRLILTRRPRAAQLLEAGDQLGNLLAPAAIRNVRQAETQQ